jgi:hypothetical protein
MKPRSEKKRRTGGHADGVLRRGMMLSNDAMSSLGITHGGLGFLGLPRLRLLVW